MDTKLRIILTQEEMNRITSRIKDGKPEMTVDLHKLTVKQARRLLGNIIAVGDSGADIKAIHGYNHGTAIKSMILNDLHSPRILTKETDINNPGLTDIRLAA